MSMGRISILAVLISLAISSYSFAQESQNPLNIAQGTWELDPKDNDEVGDYQCEKDPLKISIDIPAMRYKSEHGEYVSVASITEVGENHFWLTYDGEERLDNHGKPVSWAFVLEDQNHFYWVRNDWLHEDGFENTSRRRRCADSDQNLVG